MTKKLTLASAALLLAVGAYVLLSRSDRHDSRGAPAPAPQGLDRFIARSQTAPAAGFSPDDLKISPGEKPLAEIFDDKTGRLKYRFRAQTWGPAPGAQDEYLCDALEIQIHTPRGQITYVQADKASVTIARNARNSQDVKRGHLTGNVIVSIDRTTSEWRAAHPDQADRYAHPDVLIHITMQDARFDLDASELIARGDIVIDGSEARIEAVRDLTLRWSPLDNRIDALRFAHGGRMTLRRGGRAIEIGIPGTEHESRPESDRSLAGDLGSDAAGGSRAPRAQAMKPMSIARVTADEAADEIRQEAGVSTANQARSLRKPAALTAGGPVSGAAPPVRSPEDLAADVTRLRAEARAGAAGVTTQPGGLSLADLDGPRRDRVQTYRAVFENRVLVEQHEGLRQRGRLEADRLEINFDFGKKQESLAGGPKSGESLAARGDGPRPEGGAGAAGAPESRPEDSAQDDRTRLVLTWDGPLELRPLLVGAEEQTGERFDAIALGAPVRIKSDQGDAECRQLVYRHERRQVWLAGEEGSAEATVQLAVGPTRRLVCGAVFYDQSRGLARIDGAGYMIDDRRRDGANEPNDALSGTWLDAGGPPRVGGSRKSSEPVEIHWKQGVDLEIARRPAQRVNPATGAVEVREKDFLRRAWFHGEVQVAQGSQKIRGDELAVTFGVPGTRGARAEYIEHIDAAGSVRMEAEDQVIAAARLEVEMAVSPDGRNVPRVADAEGDVFVRQGGFEARAGKMHVVMSPAPGDDGMQIDQFDAERAVSLVDPAVQLDIHDAERVTAKLKAGAGRDASGRPELVLVDALIIGAEPDGLAHAGHEDFAVDGHRIEIDAERQRIEVPGPGRARMITRRDFGGRELSKPEVVDTTWQGSMLMNLSENYGQFLGAVHSESESFTLGGEKLTIRFAKAPPRKEEESLLDHPRLRRLRALVEQRRRRTQEGPVLAEQERKRPSFVLAEGNASAVASKYAEPPAPGAKGRLLSRLSIFGAAIEADLLRQEMAVPCAGNLLIEDYQFKAPPGPGRPKPDRAAGGLMTSSSEDGPSQTAFTWANSMKYFVDQGLVAFDKSVHMEHRSGRHMVMKEELLRAAGVDPAAVPKSGGRRAALDAGRLLVEFMPDESARPSAEQRALLRATDLKRLIAERDVHLQDGPMSLMGDHLQYAAQTEDVVLEGTTGMQARIFEQDEDKQNANMWRGPRLVWNRRTNRIEAHDAVIRSTRR